MDTFCETPNAVNYREMDPLLQKAFFVVARICVDKDIGDVELSNKILNYYMFNNLSPNNQRFIRSFLLALRWLQDDDVSSVYEIIVYERKTSKNPIYKVRYGTEFEELYWVSKNNKKLGLKKELNLDFNVLKQDIIYDLFTHKLNIYSIYVGEIKKENIGKHSYYVSGKRKQPFFKRDIGTIWQKEDCADCLDIYGAKCENKDKNYFRKLLLRYHPDKNKSKDAGEKFINVQKCKELCIDKDCVSTIKHRPI